MGVAVIELLIAFALITLTLTGVVIAVSGNQSLALSTELNNLALYKVEEKLEDAFGQSRIGFDSIVSAAAIDGVFSIDTDVVGDNTDCYKLVNTVSSWGSAIYLQDLGLFTWFANPDAVAVHAGDCPTHPLSDDFDDPNAFKQTDIGGEPSTAIDVFGDYVYMTANAAADGKSDIYIYTINDLINDVSEDPLGEAHTGQGLNTIDVGKFGSEVYAFTMSGDRMDVPEVQVINVTNPLAPAPVIATATPDVVVTCDEYCPPAGEIIRQAIYISGDFLYVGIHRIGDDEDEPGEGGGEFYVLDITDPANPQWRGGLDVNHNVNDIVVAESYAFLATSDNTGEVLVVDVSDPDDPQLAGDGFDADGDDDGKSLALVGSELYLGRRNAGSDGDFYILDVTNPESISALSDPYNMNLNGSKTEVRGIVVRETITEGNTTKLAFLAVNDPNESLFILRVTNPENIQPVSSCTDGYNTEQKPTGIDIENSGRYVFMSNESQKNLKIIEDDNSCG